MSLEHKKGEMKEASTPDIKEINLSLIDQDELFTVSDLDGKIQHTEFISNTPIFELSNEVYFVIPLKQLEDSAVKSLKSVVGIYGSKSGYGLDPIEFYTEIEDAKPNAIITEANELVNTNQSRIIELGIKEALNNGQELERSSNLLLNKLEACDIDAIVSKIRDKVRYYIKLDDDLQYVITTCFILGTYLFPLFSTFGYLIISGEKGAGKGTFMDVMERTCWNPTSKQISVSEAVLFRRIAEQRPTMIIDEYHRAIKNKNSGNSLISILESGYEKGGAVPRIEETREGNTRKHKVVDYPVYSPKILATRQPVEADDKGIKIIMPKLTTDQKYAKRKKELQYDSFFETIRLSIMKWCISNQNSILKEYRSIEPNSQLNGREFNVWLPVLAIARVAFPEQYENLLKFAGETVCNTRSTTYEKEDRVLTALYYLCKKKKLKDGGDRLSTQSYKVTNKEISGILQEMEDEGIHHNTIKSALENLKIVGKFETGTYWIRKAKLKDKWKEKGFFEESKSKDSTTEDHKVKLTEKTPDYNNLTLTESAVCSILATLRAYTVSLLIKELVDTGKYLEEDIREALNDMRARGEIEISGRWSK